MICCIIHCNRPDAGNLQEEHVNLDRGDELAEKVRNASDGTAMPEIFYTVCARLKALRGDYDGALSLADMAAKAGIARLRTYAPALMGLCFANDSHGADRAHAAARSAGFVLTEHEFHALLRCHSACGSGPRVLSTLSEMSEELVEVSEPTAEVVASFFRSDPATSLFAPNSPLAGRGQGWSVERCSADDKGNTPAGELLPVALKDHEWVEFLAGVRKIAEERENRQKSFVNFMQWLQRSGPYHAIIDGANVAMYGQNRPEGHFQFDQIRQCVQVLKDNYPDLRPLVFLSIGRTKSQLARTPQVTRVRIRSGMVPTSEMGLRGTVDETCPDLSSSVLHTMVAASASPSHVVTRSHAGCGRAGLPQERKSTLCDAGGVQRRLVLAVRRAGGGRERDAHIQRPNAGPHILSSRPQILQGDTACPCAHAPATMPTARRCGVPLRDFFHAALLPDSRP